MRKIIATTFFTVCVVVSFCQSNDKLMLTELGKLVDQYDHVFKPESVSEKFTIVYVSGADDPFGKVYDKLKGRSLKKNANVQFVGGFKETAARMGGDPASAKKHIQEAMVFRYGENHFPILIDIESKIAPTLGYAIITFSRKSGRTITTTDYGIDRKRFFDAINLYFSK